MKITISRLLALGIVLAILMTSIVSIAVAEDVNTDAPTATGQLSIAHFAPFAEDLVNTSVTISISGAYDLTDFQYGDNTTDVSFTAGTYDVEVRATDGGALLASTTITVLEDHFYTLGFIGNITEKPLELYYLEDDGVPLPESAKLRIVHAAPLAADDADTAIDICTDENEIFLGSADMEYKDFSDPYLIVEPGSYKLHVAEAGTNCEVSLFDIPSLSFVNQQLADLWIIGDGVNQPLDHSTVTGLLYTKLAHIKFANFAKFTDNIDESALTVRVKTDFFSKDVVTGLKYTDIAGYFDIEYGTYDIEFWIEETDTLLVSKELTFEMFTFYSVLAIGNEIYQPYEVFVLEDIMDPPGTSVSQSVGANLRVAHVAPFASDINDTAVDVCTESGDLVTGATDMVYKETSDPYYLNLESGVHDWKVTTAGSDCEDELWDIPPMKLLEGQVAHLYLICDGAVCDGCDFVYFVYLPLIADPTSFVPR